MKQSSLAALIGILAVGATTAAAETCDIDALRYDQLQVIGTHNSYKIEVDHSVDHAMRKFDYREDERFDAGKITYRMAYQHPPLDVQLDVGVRALEIDIHDDPEGGLFAKPGAYAAMAALGLEPNAAYDPQGVMRAPGFKVLHVPDWDFLSNCPTLEGCLTTLADWSARHPDHFPIMIRIEAKERSMPAIGGIYAPVAVRAFDADAFLRLEAEVTRLVGKARIYPRASYAGQWPRVDALRGKFIFVLSGESDVGLRYQAALRDRARLFFTFNEPPEVLPVANLGQAPNKARASASGSLLYTRSETVETHEARTNDTAPRDRAFNGAGNIIWTDYAIPDARFSPYRVRFPDGAYVRPHPLRSTAACRAAARPAG